MNKKERIFLVDLAAYISWACKKKLSARDILTNVAHDVTGYLYSGPYFLPRTAGYYNRQAIEKSQE